VTYDGNVVTTPMFNPPPKPGVTSSIPIPIPQPPDDYPAGMSHTMTIEDTCGPSCSCPKITMKFTPPTLKIFAPSPQENAPVVASIVVPTQATFVHLNLPNPDMFGGTTVTLKADNPIVNFKATSSDPGGDSISLVFGPKQIENQFYVQAKTGQTMVGKQFTVIGKAPGFQVGTQMGSIQQQSPGP
jgi:hypothetical protein